MINLYGLTYRVPTYAIKSIDSLIRNASEPFSMTVCDNFSEGSSEIRDYLKQKVDSGDIKRALLFKENNIGWSLCTSLIEFPPDNSEKFFCLTDLDLVVPEGCDWISHIKKAHYQENCILTGCTLDMSNYYNTPNHGYGGDDDGFGIWLLGINTELYYRHFPPDRTNVVDFHMRQTFGMLGRVKKILDIRLYHLAWDLWKDDLEYFQFKKNSPGWCYRGLPENMEYELYERKD
jgi:hypothetical protein